MDFSAWVDHGVVPPRRLPAESVEVTCYLAEALGHLVYERWTWRRLTQVYGALPDARRAKPAVCRLLIDHESAVEAWQRGRVAVFADDQAPATELVVQALLKTHRRRFRRAAAAPATERTALTQHGPAEGLHDEMAALPRALTVWLERAGRLVNPHEDTNTLGARDDHAALAAFLRERAGRSRHTWRAYTAELQRLVHWCHERQSDHCRI